MCGIAGILNFDFSIHSLLNAQDYRGPDAMGIELIEIDAQQSLQLGHNRLKIIDLSDQANQPWVDTSKTHYLVYNGEIYNFRELREELVAQGQIFVTQSDTEVLFKALIVWGREAVNKLDGMFAFAFYNQNTKSLWLGRDRFGVKPLYYHYQDGRLVFASTSQAIAGHLGLKPNHRYLSRGLQYGIYDTQDEQTAYEHLNIVPAGHVLELQDRDKWLPKLRQFYDFRSKIMQKRRAIAGYSKAELLTLVTQQFQRACQKRLVSDVPIAIALSGGLDSSAVSATVAASNQEIEAFCFGNPEDRKTEGYLAQALAQQCKIKIHFVKPKAEDWVSAFWHTLEIQDAPFAGLSIVAQNLLYQAIHQLGYKVVLGGQGGDEGFLGYRKFQLFYLRELIDNKAWMKTACQMLMFSKMLWAERSRLALYWQIKSRYHRQSGESVHLKLADRQILSDIGYTGDLGQRQIEDVLNYSLPTLLRYEDRNSMGHSIESRLPFLDYQLMELACALPTDLKLHDGYGKWMLREMMNSKIPDSIAWARYKRGFDVTEQKTIYQQLQPSIQAELKAHADFYRSLTGSKDLQAYFSADALVRSPHRFIELTTVLWLRHRS